MATINVDKSMDKHGVRIVARIPGIPAKDIVNVSTVGPILVLNIVGMEPVTFNLSGDWPVRKNDRTLVYLPNISEMNAVYKNSVLTVTVPWLEAPTKKKSATIKF